MPQTRFVLRKALELQKRVVVVVNKIDRPAARPEWVIDSTYELFMDLGASDELCEFPVVYASGGWAVVRAPCRGCRRQRGGLEGGEHGSTCRASVQHHCSLSLCWRRDLNLHAQRLCMDRCERHCGHDPR